MISGDGTVLCCIAILTSDKCTFSHLYCTYTLSVGELPARDLFETSILFSGTLGGFSFNVMFSFQWEIIPESIDSLKFPLLPWVADKSQQLFILLGESSQTTAVQNQLNIGIHSLELGHYTFLPSREVRISPSQIINTSRYWLKGNRTAKFIGVKSGTWTQLTLSCTSRYPYWWILRRNFILSII